MCLLRRCYYGSIDCTSVRISWFVPFFVVTYRKNKKNGARYIYNLYYIIMIMIWIIIMIMYYIIKYIYSICLSLYVYV